MLASEGVPASLLLLTVFSLPIRFVVAPRSPALIRGASPRGEFPDRARALGPILCLSDIWRTSIIQRIKWVSELRTHGPFGVDLCISPVRHRALLRTLMRASALRSALRKVSANRYESSHLRRAEPRAHIPAQSRTSQECLSRTDKPARSILPVAVSESGDCS